MKAPTTRSLLLAVVQEQDLDLATRTLHDLDLPVIYLSSLGGFLAMRNATLLLGLRQGEETKDIEALEKACRKRIEYLALPLEGSPLPMAMPVPVTVGGATVFTLPVENFVEI